MNSIPVRVAPSDAPGYDIILARGALSSVGDLLPLRRKVLIVTDSGVPAAYAETVAAACQTPVHVCLPMGEANKCFEQFRALLTTMMQASFTRGDCVVAVGGGVVGDLSGFAAACYMRGIDFYNIPTTLLSQVDSSIGGKTAIDVDGVKNIIGAFYQPKRVIIDPDTLRTLDDRQLRAGLAEAIKMAVICDTELFEMIRDSEDLREDLPEIIRRALMIKKRVVEEDPTEKGLRRVLNFGHTVGHAIESFYGGRYLHGECVALGMLPMCAPEVRARLLPVLEKYQLPVEVEARADQLLPYILHDKKMKSDKVTAVYVETLGSFVFRDVPPASLFDREEVSEA